jgi:hypothetical protein
VLGPNQPAQNQGQVPTQAHEYFISKKRRQSRKQAGNNKNDKKISKDISLMDQGDIILFISLVLF